MKNHQSQDRGVSEVIGVVLMVAITVIVAAVVANLALNIGSDTKEPVNAGVRVNFDANENRVEAVWVSNSNAGHINVTFTGSWDGGTPAKARLNAVGDRAVLNTSTLSVDGSASVVNQSGGYPSDGDEITVNAIAHKRGETTSNPVSYESGNI